MSQLSFFSFFNGEKYGQTIGSEMKDGSSLEDAIRKAYREHGVIPLSKLYMSVISPGLVSTIGGVVGGYYNQKVGIMNEKLLAALIKVTKEMS